MEKFDYLILNEDNEWLSTGKQATQEEFEQDLEDVRKRQFDRWGEDIGVVIFKAPVMESFTVIGE